MTVSSAIAKSGPYTGADDFVFAYNFRVFADSEIQVTTVVSTTGVEEILTLTTDYTVQNAGGPTGTITLTAGTFPTGLPGTKKLAVSRNMGFLQEIDFENQGGFFPDTHENGFDRLKMEVQQVKEEVDRSVKVDITGTTTPDDLLAAITASAAAAAASAAAAAASETAAAASEANCAADEIATAADAVATAADRVQTGLDATATAADAVSTAADEIATAADAVATAADRVQTGLDVTATAADAVSTAADAASAAASWDQFDDRYLGSKASDPSLDNDGNALLTGALYWDTTSDIMKVYDGVAWQNVSTVGYTKAESDANFQPINQSPWNVGYSGTPGAVSEIAVTSLPSWVTEIKIVGDGLSSAAGSNFLSSQLGKAAGYVTTGYVGRLSYGSSDSAWGGTRAEIGIYGGAADVRQNSVTITKGLNDNWSVNANEVVTNSTSDVMLSLGSVDVGGTLDRIKVYWDSAANFDAGDLTILYR